MSKRFAVTVNGENFLFEHEGVLAKYGFFTIRIVDARDLAEAEKLGIETVRNDVKELLKDSLQNAADDRQTMTLENIQESETSAEACPNGFIWYEMNPKRWWQFWRR